MTTISETIFSGFISKIVNDVVDVSKDKIKSEVKNKNMKHQTLESQIYNITIDVLNKITNNKCKINQDKVYDAAEAFLKSSKENKEDDLRNIKSCLKVLSLEADEDIYRNFRISLYEELGKDEYCELYRAILLLLLEQKNKHDYVINDQLNKKLDEVILALNRRKDNYESNNAKHKVKSRTQEYADKWNANMFLNNFDKRDENAGVNVKLCDVYVDEHLPHYIWCNNKIEYNDLKDLLSEYIYKENENKMLLVLGQLGIGKSTLITWFVANYIEKKDDILVYQFATDLKKVDWQSSKICQEILDALYLSYDDLNGKTLIIDGFDEISVSDNRENILDTLYSELIYRKTLKNFSLIITCRENYIQRFERLKCKYIILRQWNEKQIKSFCKVFNEKTKSSLSEGTIEIVNENKEILGIPLILYMALALNISIEKESSIVDVYDRIFSLEGGIYDRCIENKKFADIHRIGKIKKQIHQISKEIAFWMFENNPDETSIPQEEYRKICSKTVEESGHGCVDIELDFMIGNFFLIKHCENIQGGKIYFVHRSIYEYFVVETIYNSMEEPMIVLSEEKQEVLAGEIAFLLKTGKITLTMRDFFQYKLKKFFQNMAEIQRLELYGWWERAIKKMLKYGMFYYTKHNIQDYSNIIDKEITCFTNIINILRIIADECKYNGYILDGNYEQLEKYVKYSVLNNLIVTKASDIQIADMDKYRLDFSRLNLSGFDLKGLDFSGANLSDSNLSGADLRKCGFIFADLKGADLSGSNIEYADFNRANLKQTKLEEVDFTQICVFRIIGLDSAKLNDSKWTIEEIILLHDELRKADFESIKVVSLEGETFKIDKQLALELGSV